MMQWFGGVALTRRRLGFVRWSGQRQRCDQFQEMLPLGCLWRLQGHAGRAETIDLRLEQIGEDDTWYGGCFVPWLTR